ncbi:MAG: sodium:proton antiporter [Nocardioidaceae bacterium]
MLPYVVAAWIFVVGCIGMVMSRNLVHAIVCLSVVQSSTYLLLVSIGYAHGGTAPIFADVKTGVRVVDPVVQALTLTDVVVGSTVTALLLAITIQVGKQHGSLDPDEIRSLEQESEE